MDNIHVRSHGQLSTAHFELNNARYHIWLDQHGRPMHPLYKAPPLEIGKRDKGFFEIQLLDPTLPEILPLVEQLMKAVIEGDMFAKAKAELAAGLCRAREDARRKELFKYRRALSRASAQLTALDKGRPLQVIGLIEQLMTTATDDQLLRVGRAFGAEA